MNLRDSGLFTPQELARMDAMEAELRSLPPHETRGKLTGRALELVETQRAIANVAIFRDTSRRCQ